jgi:integrase
MSFSLHRRKGSPYWYAWFRVPDPDRPEGWRQTCKSTRKRKKEDAKIWAREQEETERKKVGAGCERSREIYSILKVAADNASAGELSEIRARHYLSKILETSTGHGLKVYTVREWFDQWLSDVEKASPEGTLKKYRGIAEQFLAHLPESRADGNLMNLSAEDVRGFRDAQIAAGKAGSTINVAIKVLRTPLNKARREGVIFSNPAEAVGLIAVEELEKATFTPGGIKKLLAAAGEDWKGVILFGYYTGANLSNIVEMRWDVIDLEKGTLTYRRKKKGRALVTVPLHPELSEWMLSRPAGDDPKALVFPELEGMVTGGVNGLSATFAGLMEKAEIQGESKAPREAAKDGEKSKGRTRNALTFHSLRHSFNSAMANAGVAQETRQKLTGHASAAINKVYTHHELETLRDAIEAVPGLQSRKAKNGK